MKYDKAGMQQLLTDGRYSDIGNLPSNFFPYKHLNVSQLYARPFTINELRLISRAAVLKDISYLVRAVDLCTSFDAGELTIGDFYYVLMWLRIQSMPKTPYVMEWECSEAVVVNRETGVWLMNDHTFEMPTDEENYRVEACATHNSEVIHFTQVEIQSLEDDFPGLPDDSALEFDWPRAKLLQDIRTSRENPELKLLVEAAQWIKDGATIEDKVNLMEAASNNLQLFDDASALNEKTIHGVSEHMKLSCRKCLHSAPHQLHIDPLTFFR